MHIPLISSLFPQRARAESESSEENEQAITADTNAASEGAITQLDGATVSQRLPGMLGITIYTSWNENPATLQLTMDAIHVEDILKQIANGPPRPHRSSKYHLTGLAGFTVNGVFYKFPVRVNLNWFENHSNQLVYFRPKEDKPQPDDLKEWDVIVSLQKTEPELENFLQSAEIGMQQVYFRNAQKFMKDITSSKLQINGPVLAQPWMEMKQQQASANSLAAASSGGSNATGAVPARVRPLTAASATATSGSNAGTTMLPGLSLPSTGTITAVAGPGPGMTTVPSVPHSTMTLGTAPAVSQDVAVPPAPGGGIPLRSMGTSGPTAVVSLDYLAGLEAKAELYEGAYQGEVKKNETMRKEHTTEKDKMRTDFTGVLKDQQDSTRTMLKEHTTEKDKMRTDFTGVLKDQQDSTRTMLKEQGDSSRDLVSTVCATFSTETAKQREETDKQRKMYKDESDKKQKTIDSLAMGLHAANNDPVNKKQLAQNALGKAKKTVSVSDPPVKTSEAVAHDGEGPKKRRGLAKAEAKAVSFAPETPQQKPRAQRSGSVVKQPPNTPSARLKAAVGKKVMVVETNTEWDGRVGKLGEMSGNNMFPVTVTSDEFSGTKYFRTKNLDLV